MSTNDDNLQTNDDAAAATIPDFSAGETNPAAINDGNAVATSDNVNNSAAVLAAMDDSNSKLQEQEEEDANEQSELEMDSHANATLMQHREEVVVARDISSIEADLLLQEQQQHQPAANEDEDGNADDDALFTRQTVTQPFHTNHKEKEEGGGEEESKTVSDNFEAKQGMQQQFQYKNQDEADSASDNIDNRCTEIAEITENNINNNSTSFGVAATQQHLQAEVEEENEFVSSEAQMANVTEMAKTVSSDLYFQTDADNAEVVNEMYHQPEDRTADRERNNVENDAIISENHTFGENAIINRKYDERKDNENSTQCAKQNASEESEQMENNVSFTEIVKESDKNEGEKLEEKEIKSIEDIYEKLENNENDKTTSNDTEAADEVVHTNKLKTYSAGDDDEEEEEELHQSSTEALIADVSGDNANIERKLEETSRLEDKQCKFQEMQQENVTVKLHFSEKEFEEDILVNQKYEDKTMDESDGSNVLQERFTVIECKNADNSSMPCFDEKPEKEEVEKLRKTEDIVNQVEPIQPTAIQMAGEDNSYNPPITSMPFIPKSTNPKPYQSTMEYAIHSIECDEQSKICTPNTEVTVASNVEDESKMPTRPPRSKQSTPERQRDYRLETATITTTDDVQGHEKITHVESISLNDNNKPVSTDSKEIEHATKEFDNTGTSAEYVKPATVPMREKLSQRMRRFCLLL